MITAAIAVGTTITFGAPIGGVLFSIELTSHIYNIQNLWRAMYSATISYFIFKITHSFEIIALFTAKAHDFFQEDESIFEYNQEYIYIIILSILMGILGPF